MSTVEIVRADEGWQAVHRETGMEGSGDSETAALLALVAAMEGISDEELQQIKEGYLAEGPLSEEFERRAKRGREQVESGDTVPLSDL